MKKRPNIEESETQEEPGILERLEKETDNLFSESKPFNPGEKSFNCTSCTKSFAHPCEFQRHLSLHTGEKHYSCPKCPKSFVTSSNLNQHMKVHTGEKPFNCFRKKSFSCSCNLRKHISFYSGEKPFSCSYCTQSFVLSGTWRDIWEFTPVRNPTVAPSVNSNLPSHVTLKAIWYFTLVRNPTAAPTVKSYLAY